MDILSRRTLHGPLNPPLFSFRMEVLGQVRAREEGTPGGQAGSGHA